MALGVAVQVLPAVIWECPEALAVAGPRILSIPALVGMGGTSEAAAAAVPFRVEGKVEPVGFLGAVELEDYSITEAGAGGMAAAAVVVHVAAQV